MTYGGRWGQREGARPLEASAADASSTAADEASDADQSGFLARAGEVSQKVLDTFPLRVWQRFQRRNGLLLASGTSDQAVFAVFAALYIVFAVVGIWLGASRSAIDGVIDMVNGIAPGLVRVDDSSPGLVPAQQIRDVAADSAGLLSVTGVLAVLAFTWTAVGWITFLRSSVRDIFRLPPVDTNFAIVKIWDFVAAVGFALLLFTGAILSTVGTSALGFAFELLGWSDKSIWFDLAGRTVTIAVAFAVDVVMLVTLFRFLAGTDLAIRRVLPGALIGGTGLVLLQLSAGWLIGRAPSNPLVATFAVVIGLLLWFRLAMIVILVAAAWVAEAADDADIAIVALSEHDHRVGEARVLLAAAQVRVRDRQLMRAAAPWYRQSSARRSVQRAVDELAAAEARLANAQLAREEARRRGRRRRRGDAEASGAPTNTATPPHGIQGVGGRG